MAAAAEDRPDEPDRSASPDARRKGRNVLGGALKDCSHAPLTGWHRDGCCSTGMGDDGVHVVCAVMTDEFLAFSKARGNDLSSPMPMHGFPGLQAGDQWCLCAPRWKEAYDAGQAPMVVLEATHMAALEYASLEELQQHAAD
ncbi:DUF2237 family protein [Alienimonas chondri]|uniref:DUF2237 domain-containing protein n=1 Tax=Alienimonas chondri TaxID=2681879 RepID=A0ABX1VFJ1_9PLAN|nr:DUF2237 domain-containing protein [Alienimonas chondri]NNJ26285.1 hypothetical protein [Alienimonas chondri]